jgi:hypothetical protein
MDEVKASARNGTVDCLVCGGSTVDCLVCGDWKNERIRAKMVP